MIELGFDPKTHDFRMLKKVNRYIEEMIKLGGSDLHIKAQAPIYARIHGDIIPLTTEIMSKEDALLLAKELLKSRFEELVHNKDVDLIYTFNKQYRCRVNIFFQLDGVSAVFRLIPTSVKTIDELGLPEALKKIAALKRGLVLVTGVTGSGKSTTLAALIDEINRTRSEHIITIEDPVEFVHANKNCIINQRSIGQDALTYARALRAALREDPDIILIGEMRDLETIEMALHAAETGHLVLSTLHTLNAQETVNRIISVFPPEEQNHIRVVLASVLQAVISQRLVKTVDGKRTAALEIMFNTERIATMIAEKRDMLIRDAMVEGDVYGMQTFDQALAILYEQGKITMDEALANATSPADLKLKLNEMHLENGSQVQEKVIDLKL